MLFFQRNSAKFSEIQRNSAKFSEIQRNSAKFSEIQKKKTKTEKRKQKEKRKEPKEIKNSFEESFKESTFYNKQTQDESHLRDILKFIEKKNNIEELTNKLKETKITVDNEKRRVTTTVYDYLKNPNVNLEEIIKNYNLDLNYPHEVVEEVEIQIKYEGYIKKIEREAEKTN